MTPDQTLIVAHHIGGRGGTGAMRAPDAFIDDLLHVYYDADAECTDQIVFANAKQPRLVVLPQCIGKTQGKRPFHIDYDPFMSSLLELNPAYGDYTLFLIDPLKGALDYQFSDTGRAMETREVEVTSLDALCFGAQPVALAPDFLSMDTQGSEYEILEGASQALKNNVLALRLEVAFQPIYKDQKLFGDLCQLLVARGFQFVKMLEVFEMYPTREPLGLRAGSFDAFGEALFFRTPESLAAHPDPDSRHLQYLKMAMIALEQGQLGYALHCLRRLEPPSPELANLLANRSYPAFLKGLVERAAAHPRAYPPKFSECYTFQESMARFGQNSGFPTMESHFHEIVANLRKDVAQQGGTRLCVLPFGLYARKMHELEADADTVPLAFFDNGWRKHHEAGFRVEDPATLGPDDYVVILSQSYGPEIEKQLVGIRGDNPAKTLSYKDLIAGRWAFDKPQGSTEVEDWLTQHGFEALAQNVCQLRLAQTHRARHT